MSRLIIPGLIIGSKVSIAKFGAVISSGEPSKTVSADWAARPPDCGSPRPLALYGQDTHQQPSD